MEQKKKILIISICAVIVCIAIACVCIFTIGKKREKNIKTQMGSFITVDSELYCEGVQTEKSEDIGTNILTCILNYVTYEVKTVKSDSCTLEITSPNVYKLYSKVMEEHSIEMFTTYDEYKSAVADRLNQIQKEIQEGNYEMRTTTVKVPIKEGTIETTKEFADAIYGGLVTLQEEIIEKYIQEGTTNE